MNLQTNKYSEYVMCSVISNLYCLCTLENLYASANKRYDNTWSEGD